MELIEHVLGLVGLVAQRAQQSAQAGVVAHVPAHGCGQQPLGVLQLVLGVQEVAAELGAGHVGGHQLVGQLGEHLAEEPVGRADSHLHLHGSHSAGCSGA